MFVYCTDNLTNNGLISMTARGAKAKGENVYLFKKLDGSFEYVPAQSPYIDNGYENPSLYSGLTGKTGASGTGRSTAQGRLRRF